MQEILNGNQLPNNELFVMNSQQDSIFAHGQQQANNESIESKSQNQLQSSNEINRFNNNLMNVQNQDQDEQSLLKLLMQQKNIIKQVEIRKTSTKLLLSQRRMKFASKQNTLPFDLEKYRSLQQKLKNFQTMNIEQIVEVVNELSDFDYESDIFESYIAKLSQQKSEYKGDINIMQFFFEICQKYQGYEKVIDYCYCFLTHFTYSPKVCEIFSYKNHIDGIIPWLSSQKNEDIRDHAFRIVSNILADDDKYVQQEMQKKNILGFIIQNNLVDIEVLPLLVQLVHNYSFIIQMSCQEVHQGVQIIGQIMHLIYKTTFTNDNSTNTQDDMRYQLFLEILMSFVQFIKAHDRLRQKEQEFSEIFQIMENLVLGNFQQYMTETVVMQQVKVIFQTLAFSERDGPQFYFELKQYFEMIFKIDFQFLNFYSECYRRQGDFVMIAEDFVQNVPNLFSLLIETIARQIDVPIKYRSIALQFLEAYMDQTIHKKQMEFIKNIHIIDALALVLDMKSDPSIKVEEVQTTLEVLSSLLDLGQYLFEKSIENENIYLKHSKYVGIIQLLEQLQIHDSQSIAERASMIYEEYFTNGQE